MGFSVRNEKFVVATLVITLIFGGMTFGNLPVPEPAAGIQTVNGVTYNFADYLSLNNEHIGMLNYFDRFVTSQPYTSWDGWYLDGFLTGFRHYFIAFLDYVISTLFETTPGYRTTLYQNLSHTLIMKMNTTIEEYGNESLEYWEWEQTTYPQWYFPDPNNDSGLWVGGFRGPANIMWTGHYALMLALYERSFNTGDMTDELTYFVKDWNNSLTTDGHGNPQEGGIWKCGLIPCEPHLVFVNCNSIPIYTTELFDNLYGTQYMESGMWTYGLNYLNNVLQDEHGLFSYLSIVSPSLGSTADPAESYPYVSIDEKGPIVSGYGTSWALMFLEYTQENETIHDYTKFIDVYGRDVSRDEMYIVGSYNYNDNFADIQPVIGSFFGLKLAQQRGDYRTTERIRNFWLKSMNQVWSEDGRAMHYEGGLASVMRTLEPAVTGLCTWGTIPVTMRDVADTRPAEFWDYPYISEADDDNIWVYQAEWDPDKSAFILNIKVDQSSTLTFSNFESAPTAYAGGVSIQQLTASGDHYTLTLSPGTYNIVIL